MFSIRRFFTISKNLPSFQTLWKRRDFNELGSAFNNIIGSKFSTKNLKKLKSKNNLTKLSKKKLTTQSKTKKKLKNDSSFTKRKEALRHLIKKEHGPNYTSENNEFIRKNHPFNEFHEQEINSSRSAETYNAKGNDVNEVPKVRIISDPHTRDDNRLDISNPNKLSNKDHKNLFQKSKKVNKVIKTLVKDHSDGVILL